MPHIDPAILALIGITLAAAIVNGAIGYGFSSLTVPIALLFVTNRLLNPALVLVEVLINGYVVVMNRSGVKAILRKVWPIILGLVPMIVVGSYWLHSANPTWVKFVTYLVLMPFITMQVAGIRKRIRGGAPVRTVVGGGIGLLYSLTTISGPPLALVLNSDDLQQREFKAALGVIRLVESVFTALSYWWMGLIVMDHVQLGGWIIPGVLVGLGLGHLLIGRVQPESFRRICMGFDLAVVGFGLTRAMTELRLVPPALSYALFVAILVVDAVLMFRFFSRRAEVVRLAPASSPAAQVDAVPEPRRMTA